MLMGLWDEIQSVWDGLKGFGRNFNCLVFSRDIPVQIVVEYLPLQSGGLSVRIICPYRHVALSPPKLVYPPGHLNFRVVSSCTGSAGSVTTLFHVCSSFVQSAPEVITVLDLL